MGGIWKNGIEQRVKVSIETGLEGKERESMGLGLEQKEKEDRVKERDEKNAHILKNSRGVCAFPLVSWLEKTVEARPWHRTRASDTATSDGIAIHLIVARSPKIDPLTAMGLALVARPWGH